MTSLLHYEDTWESFYREELGKWVIQVDVLYTYTIQTPLMITTKQKTKNKKQLAIRKEFYNKQILITPATQLTCQIC